MMRPDQLRRFSYSGMLKGFIPAIAACLTFLYPFQSATACGVKPSYNHTLSHTCGLPTILTAVNASTGSRHPDTKYWWRVNGRIYGDTMTRPDTSVLYLKFPGNLMVSLFVKDSAGCIDSAGKSITVTSGAASILDQNKNYTFSPVWMNCLQFITDPDTFRISLESADTLFSARILWGDGSIDTGIGNLLPNTARTHLYTTLGVFPLKIVTTNGSCTDTVYGMVYNQRQPTAGIIGPPSGSNRGCVPHTLRIINNSYNISNNTTFLIDWGNGDRQTEPYTAFRDTLYHTYRKGVCAGIIRITATNVCGSSFTTWNPIDISDKDKALWSVTPACSPTSDFVFLNLSSDRYCLFPDVKEYFWDFGDSTTVGWTYSKASQSHRYKKEGDYFVTLIAKNSCGSDTFKSKVGVYFTPLAGFTYNEDRSCKPLAVRLTDTSHGRGLTRTWTVREAGTVKTFSDSILLYTFTKAGVHSIELKVSNPCGTSSKSKTFVVTDKPVAGFTPINSGCTPVKATFTNSTVSYFSNAVYAWDFGDSTTSNAKNPPEKIYSLPGQYAVKLIVSDSCGSDTLIRNFTVHALPKAEFLADTSACTFDSIVFRNRSVNANVFQWDFGDLQMMQTTDTLPLKKMYESAGIRTVRLIASSPAGCKDTAEAGIRIRPGAKAIFDIDTLFGCAPARFRFSNRSVYGSSYRWYANGIFISDSFTAPDTVLQYDSSVVVMQLIATSSSSCQDDTSAITFFTPKDPEALIGNADSGCGILPVTMLNKSRFAVSYRWDLDNGDSSTLFEPQTIYQSALKNDTLYHPVLYAENWAGCGQYDTGRILIFPRPEALFSSTAPAGCGPLLPGFTNASKTNNNRPFSSLTHFWNFGDGDTSTSAEPAHIFQASMQGDTVYPVCLSVTSVSGCSDTFCSTVTVYPSPVTALSADKAEGCAPLSVNFSNHTSMPDTAQNRWLSFVWKSGNGSIDSGKNFAATYGNSPAGDTLYRVVLQATSYYGCTDSAAITIRVHPDPVAQFSTDTAEGCTPLLIRTDNASYAPDASTLTHQWDFGNGYFSGSENDSSLYLNTGDNNLTYLIRYRAVSQHGCTDTAEHHITVRPKPKVRFHVPPLTYCAPAVVSLSDSSINAEAYYWSLNGPFAQDSSVIQTVLPGKSLFDTVYIAAHYVRSLFGCISDTAYRQVLVRGRPEAGFQQSKDSVCSTESIQLLNQSLAAHRYKWIFGPNDSSKLVNPVYRFPSPLTGKDTAVRVSLIAVSPAGCQDATTRSVYLAGKTDQKLQLSTNAGCTRLPVTFTHESGRYRTVVWSFGDKTPAATGDTVMHQYENTSRNQTDVYQPYLIRQRYNCYDTVYASVDVYPLPEAIAEIKREDLCDSGMHRFSSTSVWPHQAAWYIDNMPVSSLNDFRYKLTPSYQTDSMYQVRLISRNAYGCSDTSDITVQVKRKMKLAFTVPPVSTCEASPASFTNLSSHAVRYLWHFGDGAVSSAAHPSHAYQQYGNYNVVLYGYDADGCQDSVRGSAAHTVIERPGADFTYLPSFPKLPDARVQFTAKADISSVAPEQLQYEWDFGDKSATGPANRLAGTEHLYTASGKVFVTLRIWNLACMDSVVKPLLIEDPNPLPDFTPDTVQGCAPLTVKFKNHSKYFTSCRWIFGDGTPDSYEKEPTHVFSLPGKWDVTLVATGPGGTGTLTKQYLITTYARPVLDFYSVLREQGLPNADFRIVNLSNSVQNSWQLTDSTGQELQTSEEQHPAFRIQTAGSFGIRLIGISAEGCPDTLYKPAYLLTIGAGQVYVPDAFSPNGNGKNDGFAPSLYNVRENNYSFNIYNRWGELVYTTQSLDGFWDGTYKGADAEQDVYIWTVQGEYHNGDQFSFRGTVTLLR